MLYLILKALKGDNHGRLDLSKKVDLTDLDQIIKSKQNQFYAIQAKIQIIFFARYLGIPDHPEQEKSPKSIQARRIYQINEAFLESAMKKIEENLSKLDPKYVEIGQRYQEIRPKKDQKVI